MLAAGFTPKENPWPVAGVAVVPNEKLPPDGADVSGGLAFVVDVLERTEVFVGNVNEDVEPIDKLDVCMVDGIPPKDNPPEFDVVVVDTACAIDGAGDCPNENPEVGACVAACVATGVIVVLPNDKLWVVVVVAPKENPPDCAAPCVPNDNEDGAEEVGATDWTLNCVDCTAAPKAGGCPVGAGVPNPVLPVAPKAGAPPNAVGAVFVVPPNT